MIARVTDKADFRSPRTEPIRLIIASVDFSDATPSVVKVATDMARRLGANLLLLHVIEPIPGAFTYGLAPDKYPVMAELLEESRRRASAVLGKWVAKVRKEVPGAGSGISYGSPLDSLLVRAEELGADLVVVGSHGHGALGSLLPGITAASLVRRSIIPTLIVPAGVVTTAAANPSHPPSPADADHVRQF